MTSSVYVKLSNGRVVPLVAEEETLSAVALKAEMEKWLRTGQCITVTHGNGKVEEITPRGVKAIEIVREK